MTRTYFFSAKKYAKNSSLKTFDTKMVLPPTNVKNFVGDTMSDYKVLPFPSISLQAGFMSLFRVIPTVVENPLGLNEVKSRNFLDGKINNTVRPVRLHFVPLRETDEVVVRRNDVRSSAAGRMTGSHKDRKNIIKIASNELGVKELTGKNDGPRVEEYLRYCGLGKNHEWCAAFVSFCYGQAGMDVPRNPWSPALFPKARVYWKQSKFANSHIRDFISKADIFGIYGATAKRINHVGLVRQVSGDYLVSIEGNSNNRVESRRRHLRTVHAIADWVD